MAAESTEDLGRRIIQSAQEGILKFDLICVNLLISIYSVPD